MIEYSIEKNGNRWTVVMTRGKELITRRVFHVRPGNTKDEEIVMDYANTTIEETRPVPVEDTNKVLKELMKTISPLWEDQEWIQKNCNRKE